MLITTLTRRLAILKRALARSVHDEVDLALTVVAIQIDELHESREPTIDDLREWFLENFDGDIEEHREYIQTALAGLVE